MNVYEAINEGMKAASEGRLHTKSDQELDILLRGCLQHCASRPNYRALDPTIDVLRDEIKRRADKRTDEEAQNRHDAAIKESQKLQVAVQKHHKPHWTLTPGFVVLFLTMIFAAIAAWPVIREWFPTSQPASKAAHSRQPQSGSTSETPATNKISLAAPAATRDTSHFGR